MNFQMKPTPLFTINSSRIAAFSALASIAFLYGCGGHDHDAHGNDHGADTDHLAHDDHGENDAHGHGGGISVTQYTEKSELFMEYGVLMKGVPEELIIHLTRLSDFTPITEGTLEVRLISESGETYSETSNAPVRDGIFLPVITPPFASAARMELHLRSSELLDAQVIENVEIHVSSYQAPHEHEEEAEDPNALSFLKEQQWKIDYATEIVEERPIRQATPALATLRLPASGQALLPAPASGIVRFVNSKTAIEIGSETSKGQTLFTIEPDASWQVGLAKLSEDYQLAQAELERVRSLQKKNAVSEKRVLEAEIRLQTLKSALKQTGGEAAFDDPSKLRAIAKSPFDGIASAIYVKPGQRVEAGEPLALVINPSQLVLEAQVVPARIDATADLVDAMFRLAGSSRLYLVSDLGGRLLSQTPLTNEESGLAVVRFLFTNPGGKLIAGSKASAHILSGKAGATGVAIPLAAIHEEEGIPIVYVQTEGETVEKRYPRIGVSDGAYTHAKTGVQAGERVVTKGATSIRLSTLTTSEMGHGHAH